MSILYMLINSLKMKFIPYIISIFALCLAGNIILLKASMNNDVVEQNREKALLGGENGTVFDTSRNAFARPIPALKIPELRQFTFGNKIFNTSWVTAPASVKTLDGLGPVFNRSSCSGCHFKDGRGRPPIGNEKMMNSMLIRMSMKEDTNYDGVKELRPHPHYGLQLNDRSITGVPAEGNVKITYTEIPGEYSDGTKYSLRKPNYKFIDMNFGDLDLEEVAISPRVAPSVHGIGLLEAIPEETILSFIDKNDSNQDGIIGKANYVPNEKGEYVLGRFGWKSNAPTIKIQSANAALGDIGITTSINPKENCPEIQTECNNSFVEDIDMNDKQLKAMTFYLQTLATPARRDINNPVNLRGEEIFAQLNCTSCHKTNIKTGNHEIPYLANSIISPYTDLLLHDMGEGLADNRRDFAATGRMWRTAPLWGIGLIPTVNSHSFLLHDGRARNIEEAILWHDGEAKKSREEFVNLPKDDREALIAFINSL